MMKRVKNKQTSIIAICIFLLIGLFIRMFNSGNHMGFISWDAGWYFFNSQAVYSLTNFFIHHTKLVTNFFLYGEQAQLKTLLDNFRGEGFTLEFIKMFYVFNISFFMLLLPQNFHFYIPLYFNLAVACLTILVSYFISLELHPYVRIRYVIPILVTYSGISIFFAKQNMTVNLAVFLLFLLVWFTLKQLNKQNRINNIIIGILLGLLPATHEFLTFVPFIYISVFFLFKFTYKNHSIKIRIISIYLILLTLAFEFISIVKRNLILHFTHRQVCDYFSQIFLQARLNNPSLNLLSSLIEKINRFFNIIFHAEGAVFLLLMVLAMFSIPIIKKRYKSDIKITFIYIFILSLILISFVTPVYTRILALYIPLVFILIGINMIT